MTQPTTIPSNSATLFDAMVRRAEQGAVFAQLGGREVTYEETIGRIRSSCGWFEELGLAPGSFIMIQTSDEASAITLFLSAMLDGLVPVLITAETQPPRARGICEKLSPSLVFLDEKRRLLDSWMGTIPTIGILPEAKSRSGLLARLRPGTEAKASGETYPGRLSRVQAREPRCASGSDDLAYVAFTSGTTSEPKGVQVTHRNVFCHLATLCRVFGYDEDSRIFNAMILAHADGLIQGPVLAAFSGGMLLRPGPFQIQTLEEHLNRVHQARVTHFITVPTVYAMIDRYGQHADYFEDTELKHVISVAAKLDEDLWRRFEERFGRRLVNIYGLTETVAGGLFSGPGDAMGGIGTIGTPVDMDARVVDPTALMDVDKDAEGELWLRGDNVSPGYLHDPAENAQRFAGEWLRTGDIVNRQGSGSFVILGRIKSIINCGGLLIRPEEIDEVLRMHPGVAEAATVGLEDAEFGEVPVSAVITSVPNTDLMAHCRIHLEALKIPRRIVRVDRIPRGDAGKPLAAELQRMLTASLCAGMPSPTPSRISDEDILALAASTFRVGVESLAMDNGPSEIKGWDSFGHLALITACEQRFGVKLSTRAVLDITSLRRLSDALLQVV